MSVELAVVSIGRMPYGEALDLQRRLAHCRIAKEVGCDLLLLVEHPPVITLGRTFQTEHLSTSRETLAARGIDVFEIERGGDITFHGPGQLVGYPIFDLTEHRQDLHWFLRRLEHSIIRSLQELGITAARREGYTGVWTRNRKIASIGIHVKQWVTWHGFALNVATDLSYFDLIVPCWIPQVVMTSFKQELSQRTPPDLCGRAVDSVVLGVAEAFGQRPQAMGLEELPGTAFETVFTSP